MALSPSWNKKHVGSETFKRGVEPMTAHGGDDCGVAFEAVSPRRAADRGIDPRSGGIERSQWISSTACNIVIIIGGFILSRREDGL